MIYTIVELSNRYYSDQALTMGVFHSSYNNIQDAQSALKKIKAEDDKEWAEYDYPYNQAPYRYLIVDQEGNVL